MVGSLVGLHSKRIWLSDEIFSQTTVESAPWMRFLLPINMVASNLPINNHFADTGKSCM